VTTLERRIGVQDVPERARPALAFALSLAMEYQEAGGDMVSFGGCLAACIASLDTDLTSKALLALDEAVQDYVAKRNRPAP
jgi:hypothetical protein